MAWVVAKGLFRSSGLTFQRKRHTHIDVDQLFRQVGTTISSTGLIEDVHDFLKALNNTMKGARDRGAHVEITPECRHWTDYFSPLQMQCSGHTGKDAPHVFQFATVHFIHRSFHTPILVTCPSVAIARHVSCYPYDLLRPRPDAAPHPSASRTQ